jgi:hypothetical protein
MSTEPHPKKLLEPVDDAIRLLHYSRRTGETYVHWIRRFIRSQQPKQSGLEHELSGCRFCYGKILTCVIKYSM